MGNATKYRPCTAKSIRETPYWQKLGRQLQDAVTVISRVLPFRVNEYVTRELIDWDRIPDDAVFRMMFPHPDMLLPDEYARLHDALIVRGDEAAARPLIAAIQARMNPHPDGQMTQNVPTLLGAPVRGIQHKYRETLLFFPAAGQTCHAHCAFCFRWPQFMPSADLRFSATDTRQLAQYLRLHPEVTDVLITGGDPMSMHADVLARYLEPLLAPELAHLHSIRIGTKSVANWPQRFVTDADADKVLRLFERVVQSGKNLAVMAHYNHPAEMRPEVARAAIRRILATGATVRTQSPVLRHVNDDAATWRELWTGAVRLGAIPYYMFVERDTGPRAYFQVPLAETYRIFSSAYSSVSGLARTVRGPSMSTSHGKVSIDGVTDVDGQKAFVLRFLQARSPAFANQPFFAKFDPDAVWFDELVPASGERRFFFEDVPGPRIGRRPAAPDRVIPIFQHNNQTYHGKEDQSRSRFAHM